MTANIPENNADRDLRERFAALRREDAAHAPAFSQVFRRAPRERRPAWPGFAAAVALVIVAVLLGRFYHRPPASPALSLTEWQSPTDFLLETPGHELLQTVPEIGDWPEGAVVPAASPTPAGKKTS